MYHTFCTLCKVTQRNVQHAVIYWPNVHMRAFCVCTATFQTHYVQSVFAATARFCCLCIDSCSSTFCMDPLQWPRFTRQTVTVKFSQPIPARTEASAIKCCGKRTNGWSGENVDGCLTTSIDLVSFPLCLFYFCLHFSNLLCFQ